MSNPVEIESSSGYPTLPLVDLSKFIDKDIFEETKGWNVFYGDIINLQLIRTMKQLIETMEENNELRKATYKGL